MLTLESEYAFSDFAVQYWLDDATKTVELSLISAAMRTQRATRRTDIGRCHPPSVIPLPAIHPDSLVQLKLVEDGPPDHFSQGRSLRNGPSVRRLRFDRQERIDAAGETRIHTFLASDAGWTCEHVLTWRAGELAVEIITIFHNRGDAPVQLEMLSSFSLSGITPFAPDDAPERLRVYRCRSQWSAEGRLDAQTAEQLQLERSWSGHGASCERFGSTGSMPVHGFFPFAAVEDTEARVVWAAQLACSASWQMELYRKDDRLQLSGGIADRELGHWLKTIAPGTSFQTPPATVTVVQGDLDTACDRLVRTHHRLADQHPAVEADLPIICNEWCRNWGNPTHDDMLKLADRLRGTPVKFHVIDAGWYKKSGGDWSADHGDWEPNRSLFPEGLAATAAAIRERGLIPGLWFEIETVGKNSTAFSLVDHLLKRDGRPITVGSRRFWDLNDPFVKQYLAEKVIGQLRDGGFGYLKVDYNETIGIGCDHPDSLGEGLRQQVEGVHALFREMRKQLPDLVIENCSSGGHRLEPAMFGLSAQSSFSDAHEELEIPIIAANVQRLMLPGQSQIWAVLHKGDSQRRLIYSLAATFLGRMCLSGELVELTADQWEIVQRAIALYRSTWRIIKHGRSFRHGPLVGSYRHPRGWQAVVRVADDGRDALVVVHVFEAPGAASIRVPLPDGHWKVSGSLSQTPLEVQGDSLVVDSRETMSGLAVHLTRVGG